MNRQKSDEPASNRDEIDTPPYGESSLGKDHTKSSHLKGGKGTTAKVGPGHLRGRGTERLKGAKSAGKGHARRRHPWLRRLLIGTNLVLVLCLALAGSGFAYLTARYHQISRLDPTNETGGTVLKPNVKGKPFNILLVGSDTRDLGEGKNGGEFGSKEITPGQRSDVMLLVRVEPGTGRVKVLSIPRDLWVTLENGRKERINAAYELGGEKGAGSLIRTIDRELGVPVNHYVEINFKGFKSVVDAIGGVNVYFSSPVRDENTGLNVNEIGCQKLDGSNALAYVRARHLQYKDERGRWVYDPYGDLTRMERQQDFMRRVIRKSVDDGLTDPVKLNGLLSAVLKEVKLDNGLKANDLVSMAQEFRNLAPEDVQMFVLPSDDRTTSGGAKVQELRKKEAAPILRLFEPEPVAPVTSAASSTSSPPVAASTIPRGSISARVTNATSVGGAGGRVATQLRGAGVNVVGVYNADQALSQTVIGYAPGSQEKARAVATLLGVTVDPVAVPNPDGSWDVQVKVGSDLANRQAGAASSTTNASSPSAAPTTTEAQKSASTLPVSPTVTLKGSDPSRECKG